MKEIVLPDSASDDQQEATKLISAGEHTLITGQAGTGKSWLIDQIYSQLSKATLTASTGIAGVKIGGRTIHSWSGLGRAEATVDELIDRFRFRQNLQPARDRIKWTEHLIIDEISMLGCQFMEKLDMVMRAVREDYTPFGGCQLIMFGDFLQLPPVKDHHFFRSNVWHKMGVKVKVLSTVHRQKDKQFAELLQRVRLGEQTKEDNHYLLGCADHEARPGAVVLHSLNKKVDAYNAQQLDLLDGELFEYNARDTGDDPKAIEQLEKDCLSPGKLRLKVGARVMMTKNDPETGLSNGSTGTVRSLKPNKITVDWDDGPQDCLCLRATWEIKDPATREAAAQRQQYPLRLAWAMTIHKAQGMTLDAAYIYVGDCFAEGQVYVALSRMSSAEGMKLTGFSPRKIKVDAFAKAFYSHPDNPSQWGGSVPIQAPTTDPLA